MAKLQIQTRFVVLVVLGLSLLLSACSSGESGGTKPVIESFTAVPTTINRGGTSILTWDVSGATALTIDNSVGTVTGQASKEVSPATTTTYTLTASNSAGNVSSTATVTVNGSQACTDPVAIPDTKLQQAVRDALGKPSVDLTCADMARLTELKSREQNISNLEGLQHAVNLVVLDLDKNDVSDVSPLVGLNKLEQLNLNNNQISDLSLFANFTSLRGLYICCDNPYTDISPLAGLTNLVSLDIGGHDLGDISILADFDQLVNVWLWGNDLDDADMSVLEGKDLRLLNICCNNITDISFLSGFPNLEELNLCCNPVADLSPLFSFTGLEILAIPGLGISNLDFLTDFTELAFLDLQNNEITDLSALVANSGIGAGDEVNISNNRLDLNDPNVQADIQALLDRGVDLTYASQTAANLTLVPGTYNLAVIDDPTTTFRVWFDGDMLPTEEVTVTVTGPAAWNGGEPVTVTRTREDVLDGSTALITSITAVSGTYAVTMTSGSAEYAASATLDATRLLPTPQKVTVTDRTANTVSGSWDPVPGALSYQVYIREDFTGFTSPTLSSTVVTGTSATLSDLELPPGEYALEVTATTIDFTTDGPLVNPGTYDLSYNRSVPFTVQ